MEKDIFRIATKNKFQYPSTRGALNTEQLWDLPLIAANGFCLNDVAKALNAHVKNHEEESFVATGNSKILTDLVDRLDVVKAIIADKQADNKAAADRAEKRQRRHKLLEALENRDNADLASKSRDELLKELEELD